MNYKLQDLIDVPLVQDLQEKLNEIYSFPSAIIDLDGKILTAVAWQDICTKFHRVNPEAEKECIKSDLYIKEHLHEAKPAVSYTCPHGLIDNATPIIIDGKHLGNFFTGQFFLEKPDLNFFKKQAKEFGFNEKEYLEAVKKVPIWNKGKLDKYLDFIKGFIEIIAGMGLKNLREIETNRQIKEGEERYKTIIETSLDGFWVLDKTGSILEVNETYCQMSGYSRDELLKMSIPDIEAKESFIEAQSHIQEVIECGKTRFESKHKRKDGSVFDVEISTHYRIEGQFVVFIRDITKRKQFDKSLKESEENFRLIAENTGDTITVLDLDLNTTYVSPSVQKIRGYTPEEAIKQKVDEILTPDSYLKAMSVFNNILKYNLDDENISYPALELEVTHKNGQTVWVELTYSVLKDAFNNPTGFITISRDISERKKSDAMLNDIIDKNPMSIQIVDKEGYTLKTNSAHTKLFGAVPPPDFSIFRDLEQKGLGDIIELAKTGTDARFPDLCYNVHDVSPVFPDNPIWIRSVIFPLKDSNGIIEKFVIMHENINDSKIAEFHRDKQLLYTTALNDIAVLINLNNNPKEILENANRIVGETLQVDRSLIYDIAFDKGHITGLCEWLREEHPDIEHTKGVYPIELFINPFTRIKETGTYLTSHSDNINEYFLNDGSGKRLHEGFKIKSLIWYPIAFTENGYYLFTINQILENRQWTKDEIAFLESVAKQVNLALMKIRMLDERKDIEAKLKLNLERLELATKSSDIGIWDWDMETNKLDWTKEMYVLFGIQDTNTEATFELWDKVMHPDDKERSYTRMQKAIDEKIQLNNEYRVVYPDGQIRWISAVGNTIYDNFGKPIRMNGICTDITNRKLAEKEIKDSQELLLKLSNQVPGVIYQYRLFPDGSSCFPYSSNGMSMIYEYSPDDVKEDATPVFGRLHPDDIQRVSDLIFESARNLTLFICEFRVVLPVQGLRWRYSTAVPERMEDGSTLWHGIIYDITDRKLTEFELIKAKEKAEDLLTESRMQKNEITLQNERLESLLRISQYKPASKQDLLDFALSEAINLTWSKIGYIYYYNEDSKMFTLNTWSKEVMKECSVMNPQTLYKLDDTGCWGEAVRQRKPIIINDYKSGNEFIKGTPEGHVNLNRFLTIPVIADNNIVAVVGVANKGTDYDQSDVRQLTLLMDSVWRISERENMIENLKVAKEKAEESDRLKSAFLANMSHEIRTPMNGILGFAQLLKEPKLTGEEQAHFINLIEKSGTRMLNIINDIVDIARIESGLMIISKSKTNINKQLQYIETFFKPEAQSKGLQISCTVSLSDEDATINSDREKIYAILTNLVKNAIKYSNKGTIEYGYELKGKFIEFFVKDQGIGIAKDRHQAIFERFIQADISDRDAFQGAGLGLSITKAYVEMLGGKIWVESEEGNGSAFFFTIPYEITNDKSNVVKKVKTVGTEENSIKKLKILIAEDDEACEMLLRLAVKKFSKETLSVYNGIEAVETFKNNPDIDLILMDIKMPKMDGYEATRQIREINKDVIIIAQTAFAMEGDRLKTIQAGCNDYLSKPIRNELLEKLIVKYFRAKSV